MAASDASETLLDRVARVARRLPAEHVEALAAALDRLPAVAAAACRLAAADALPTGHAREEARKLLQLWSEADAAPPAGALAWSLRVASRVDRAHRDAEQIELVWTGPHGEEVSQRRTAQALLEVVRAAEQNLLLVTYALYPDKAQREALLEALGRGVAIHLICETTETSGGHFKGDPFGALGPALAEHVAVYVWPRDHREPDDDGDRGLLHVKVAVADEKKLFLSSANLTGHAMHLNMEMGLLVTGGPLPARVVRHFEHLIESGTLERERK